MCKKIHLLPKVYHVSISLVGLAGDGREWWPVTWCWYKCIYEKAVQLRVLEILTEPPLSRLESRGLGNPGEALLALSCSLPPVLSACLYSALLSKSSVEKKTLHEQQSDNKGYVHERTGWGGREQFWQQYPIIRGLGTSLRWAWISDLEQALGIILPSPFL